MQIRYSSMLFGLLGCVLLNTSTAYSQKCVIANTKLNVAYVGVPNPLDIAVEKYSCNDLAVTTDNGKIETTIDKCSYLFHTEKAGSANITVSDKKSGKQLGVVTFRVKHVPDPVAMVGGKQGGIINKNFLRAQIGILAVLQGFDFDARFVVERFTVSVIRKGATFYVEDCASPKFTKNTKDTFDKLNEGDRLLFSDIICRGPDNRSRHLLPIEFVISS